MFKCNKHCTKCNKHLIGKDYTEEILTLNRGQRRLSNEISSAKVQPFCRKHKIIIGCFDGLRKNPRKITEKIIAS